MDIIFRFIAQNYKSILWSSLFFFANIGLFKNSLIRLKILNQINDVKTKKIISLKQAAKIANFKNQNDKNSTYLIKLQPKNQPKTFAIMKQVKSNQIWIKEPSLNNVAQQSFTLLNEAIINKNIKALEKFHSQKIWLNPQIQTLQKQSWWKENIIIKGLGQIMDHQIFDIKWKYFPKKNQGLFSRFFSWFRQGFSFIIEAFLHLNDQRQILIRGHQNIGLFIKGPTVGHIFYVFSFLQNKKILIQAKIDNGQIIALAIAGSKLSMTQNLSVKLNHTNFKIAAFSLIGCFAYRMLSPKIQKSIKKFKLRIQKYSKNKRNVNQGQGQIKQFRRQNAGFQQKRTCIICYDNCRNTIIFNCKHLIMCDSCLNIYKDNKCPLCKQQIKEQKTLFQI